MALAIKISRKESGGDVIESYWLKSNMIAVTHERTPIVSSLPDAEPILIDLGQWRVSIILEGVADFTVPFEDKEGIGDIKIAYVDDLERIADPTAYTDAKRKRDPINISDKITTLNGWHENNIFIDDETVEGFTRTYQIYINSLYIVKNDVRNFYNFKLSASGFKV